MLDTHFAERETHPAQMNPRAASLTAKLRPAFVTALSVTAATVLLACGGSSSGSTGSTVSTKSTPTPLNVRQVNKNLTLPDLCTLVTSDDVATLWSVDKSQVVNIGGGNGTGVCIYGNSAASQDGLFVIGQSYPDATTAQAVDPTQLSSIYSRLYGISSAKTVNGIGDKAFEYTTTSTATGSTGAAIFVFKANILLMIILSPATDDSGVESLAKTALSRLS